MIAFRDPYSAASQPWQIGFLALLPAIREHARIAFRHLRAEARDDAINEADANACVAYARLLQLGKHVGRQATQKCRARFAVPFVIPLMKVTSHRSTSTDTVSDRRHLTVTTGQYQSVLEHHAQLCVAYLRGLKCHRMRRPRVITNQSC